jgi:carbonic anhydrase
MLIHHTDCGMPTLSDDEFRRQVQGDSARIARDVAARLRNRGADPDLMRPPA